jgi:uncharacterized membrane protein
MLESSRPFVWARLYLDHALYYKAAVDFYRAQGENMRAAEMAKSGISLAFLAENMVSVGTEAYAYFESIPEEKYLSIGEQGGFPVPVGLIYLFALLALLLAAIVVLLVLLIKLSHSLKEIRRYSPDEKIAEIRKLQDELARKWEQKKLSEQQYEQLNREYHRKMEQLLGEKSELSRLLVDLDRKKALLFAFEHALRALKKRGKKGMLLKADYQKNFDYYNKQIVSLKRAIAEQKKQLESTQKPLSFPKEAQEKQQKAVPPKRAKPARKSRAAGTKPKGKGQAKKQPLS